MRNMEQENIDIIITQINKIMTEIFTGSGDPTSEDFSITRIEPMPIWTSQNGKYFSNMGPIDNKGNNIIPKGSKYHK